MSNHQQIVELSKELQIVSHDVEQKQAQMRNILDKLSRLGPSSVADGGFNSNQMQPRMRVATIQHTSPVRHKMQSQPGIRRGRPAGNGSSNSLPDRITTLLDQNTAQTYTAAQLMEALDLGIEQRPQLYTTLNRINKAGRISKNQFGYHTAKGASVQVRKHPAPQQDNRIEMEPEHDQAEA